MGVVPLDPDAVIAKPDIKGRLRTTPKGGGRNLGLPNATNSAELTHQTELIKDKIAKYQASSQTPFDDALNKLVKGCLNNDAFSCSSHSRSYESSEDKRGRETT